MPEALLQEACHVNAGDPHVAVRSEVFEPPAALRKWRQRDDVGAVPWRSHIGVHPEMTGSRSHPMPPEHHAADPGSKCVALVLGV